MDVQASGHSGLKLYKFDEFIELDLFPMSSVVREQTNERSEAKRAVRSRRVSGVKE